MQDALPGFVHGFGTPAACRGSCGFGPGGFPSPTEQAAEERGHGAGEAQAQVGHVGHVGIHGRGRGADAHPGFGALGHDVQLQRGLGVCRLPLDFRGALRSRLLVDAFHMDAPFGLDAAVQSRFRGHLHRNRPPYPQGEAPSGRLRAVHLHRTGDLGLQRARAGVHFHRPSDVFQGRAFRYVLQHHRTGNPLNVNRPDLLRLEGAVAFLDLQPSFGQADHLEGAVEGFHPYPGPWGCLHFGRSLEHPKTLSLHRGAHTAHSGHVALVSLHLTRTVDSNAEGRFPVDGHFSAEISGEPTHRNTSSRCLRRLPTQQAQSRFDRNSSGFQIVQDAPAFFGGHAGPGFFLVGGAKPHGPNDGPQPVAKRGIG